MSDPHSKHRWYFVSVLLLLGISLACTVLVIGIRQWQQVRTMVTEAEAKSFVETMQEAAQNRDLDLCLSLMHDDVFISDNRWGRDWPMTKSDYAADLVEAFCPSDPFNRAGYTYAHQINSVEMNPTNGNATVTLSCKTTYWGRTDRYKKTIVLEKRAGKLGIASRTSRDRQFAWAE